MLDYMCAPQATALLFSPQADAVAGWVSCAGSSVRCLAHVAAFLWMCLGCAIFCAVWPCRCGLFCFSTPD